jgi:hypothetical protein
MALCQLGNLKWRIAPSAVNWNYQIDANRIETLGGQVVQILGATLSDLTITGYFGDDHGNRKVSWQLAQTFHRSIQGMIDAQTLPAKTVGSGKAIGGPVTDAAVVHAPARFIYQDGKHNWSFQVLIKGITDMDGNGALSHSTGKFSYGYRLTLFIVESNTDQLSKIASDMYIARISNGLGWKQSRFNGAMSAADAQSFLDQNGGSVTAYIDGLVTGGSS